MGWPDPGQPQIGNKRNRDETSNGSTTSARPQPKAACVLKKPNLRQQWTEVRVRGNAHQLLEKYLALARDAQAAGDRIAAENYSQHAEHYFRTINATAEGNPRSRYHQPSEGTAQPLAAAAPTPLRALMNGSGDDESERGSAPRGLT